MRRVARGLVLMLPPFIKTRLASQLFLHFHWNFCFVCFAGKESAQPPCLNMRQLEDADTGTLE